jgi:geranylgeranyl pyrophosphate synthase
LKEPEAISARSGRINAFLDEVVPAADTAPATLHGAMRHLLFPGGKRLRPALAFAGCEAVGGDWQRALPAAAAVELIHTYSLIHDDMPCMDDDDERRGRPTVHKVWDETTALLAGDALQALAFEVLARETGDAAPERARGALQDVARAASSRGLVGGQVDDLAFVPGGPDEEGRVESVHMRKSAALIAASITSGAHLGGASAAEIDLLGKFGEEVGVAFQIADDLLDAEDEEPCSTVRVLGKAGARDRAQALLESALARIDGFGPEANALRELACYAVGRPL